MRNIENIMTVINAESNHKRINILEEIQIMRMSKPADILNDIISGKNAHSTGYYHQLTEFKQLLLANIEMRNDTQPF